MLLVAAYSLNEGPDDEKVVTLGAAGRVDGSWMRTGSVVVVPIVDLAVVWLGWDEILGSPISPGKNAGTIDGSDPWKFAGSKSGVAVLLARVDPESVEFDVALPPRLNSSTGGDVVVVP